MEPKTETREPRKRYEEAFKRDCVALLEKSGKGLKAFAAEMEINHWNLRDLLGTERWHPRAVKPPPVALASASLLPL